MSAEWFYLDHEKMTCGPVSPKRLKALYLKKNIDDGTLLWNGSDVDDWTAVARIPRINALMKEPSDLHSDDLMSATASSETYSTSASDSIGTLSSNSSSKQRLQLRLAHASKPSRPSAVSVATTYCSDDYIVFVDTYSSSDSDSQAEDGTDDEKDDSAHAIGSGHVVAHRRRKRKKPKRTHRAKQLSSAKPLLISETSNTTTAQESIAATVSLEDFSLPIVKSLKSVKIVSKKSPPFRAKKVQSLSMVLPMAPLMESIHENESMTPFVASIGLDSKKKKKITVGQMDDGSSADVCVGVAVVKKEAIKHSLSLATPKTTAFLSDATVLMDCSSDQSVESELFADEYSDDVGEEKFHEEFLFFSDEMTRKKREIQSALDEVFDGFKRKLQSEVHTNGFRLELFEECFRSRIDEIEQRLLTL